MATKTPRLIWENTHGGNREDVLDDLETRRLARRTIAGIGSQVDQDGTADEPWRIIAHRRVKPGDRVFVSSRGRSLAASSAWAPLPEALSCYLRCRPIPRSRSTSLRSVSRSWSIQRRGCCCRSRTWSTLSPISLSGHRQADTPSRPACLAVIAARLGLQDAAKDDDEAEKNPPWNRDELILALDAYVRWNGNPAPKASGEIEALSRTLNELRRVLGTRATSTLRNVNGVYMKLMNFRRFDPAFAARGKAGLSRGNRLEEEIWREFHGDPPRLRQVADAIRGSLAEARSYAGFGAEPPDLLPDEAEAVEGRLLTVEHHRRERSRKIVLAKKAAAMKALRRLICEGCGFDFRECYGPRGETFIECHHIRPVAELGDGTPTRMNDLMLVCANCHRMIHARRPWWTLEELRAAIAGPPHSSPHGP